MQRQDWNPGPWLCSQHPWEATVQSSQVWAVPPVPRLPRGSDPLEWLLGALQNHPYGPLAGAPEDHPSCLPSCLLRFSSPVTLLSDCAFIHPLTVVPGALSWACPPFTRRHFLGGVTPPTHTHTDDFPSSTSSPAPLHIPTRLQPSALKVPSAPQTPDVLRTHVGLTGRRKDLRSGLVPSSAVLGPPAWDRSSPSAPWSPCMGEVRTYTCVHVLEPILREQGLSLLCIHSHNWGGNWL